MVDEHGPFPDNVGHESQDVNQQHGNTGPDEITQGAIHIDEKTRGEIHELIEEDMNGGGESNTAAAFTIGVQKIPIQSAEIFWSDLSCVVLNSASQRELGIEPSTNAGPSPRNNALQDEQHTASEGQLDPAGDPTADEMSIGEVKNEVFQLTQAFDVGKIRKHRSKDAKHVHQRWSRHRSSAHKRSTWIKPKASKLKRNLPALGTSSLSNARKRTFRQFKVVWAKMMLGKQTVIGRVSNQPLNSIPRTSSPIVHMQFSKSGKTLKNMRIDGIDLHEDEN